MSLKLNRYARKKETQRRLRRGSKYNYFITERENKTGDIWYSRMYLSGCRKLAKKQTNKKVRKSRNDFSQRGCAYRRKFDYWWTLF